MKYFIYFLFVVFVVGCGESSSPSSLSGSVSDGDIYGAKVCLDMNENGRCDANEPTTTTARDGSFSLDILKGNDISLKPVIAIGGFDTATNTLYSGTLKGIVSPSNSSLMISPLSDLVATSFLDLGTKDAAALEELENNITTLLDINTTTLYTSPMKSINVFQKVQQIENTKELVEMGLFKQLPNWGSPNVALGKRKVLRKMIKLALTQESNVSVLLDSLAIAEDINISPSEKQLIVAQINALNAKLAQLPSSTVDTMQLPSLQMGMKKILTTIHDDFDVNGSNATIVSMPSLDTLITNGEQNVSECINLIAYAQNPSLGICEKFNTPCDIPDGWQMCSLGGFYYGTDGKQYQDMVSFMDLNRLSIGDIANSFCSSEFVGGNTSTTTCANDAYLSDFVTHYKVDNLAVNEFILPIEHIEDMDFSVNQLIYKDAYMWDTTFATFDTYLGATTKPKS